MKDPIAICEKAGVELSPGKLTSTDICFVFCTSLIKVSACVAFGDFHFETHWTYQRATAFLHQGNHRNLPPLIRLEK